MTSTEFKTIVLPFYGPMRVMAVRMLGQEDGPDAVQEVLKKLWENHSDLNVKANVAAYVMRTIKNRCLDMLRSRVIEIPFEVKDDFDIEDETSPELDRLSRLDEALELLDGRKREILKLSLSGMRGEEIASKLSLSPQNVRQLLSRARQDLKKIITNRTKA